LLHSFSWLLSPSGDQEKEANEEKITSLTMPTLMKKEKHCPQEPLIFFRRWTITSQWFQRGRFSSSFKVGILIFPNSFFLLRVWSKTSRKKERKENEFKEVVS